MGIGETIRKKRIEIGYSVDELADLLGKNRATIYRYEKGDIENLPITTLEPLAKALKITPAELMGWDDDEPKDTGINTIAAHAVGELTDEEQKKIIEYVKFIKSQRNK